MRMARFIFLIALLLAANMTKADIYRCKGPDGKLTFSDVPCGSSAKKVRPDYAPRDQGTPIVDGTEYYREQARKYDHEQAVTNAIRNHQLLKGMTPDEVSASWGEPDKKEKDFGPGGSIVQDWFWHKGKHGLKVNYVHFRDGKVVSFSKEADTTPDQDK